ncbi:MAG: hypothetical protein WCK98_05520 [bacterium]
MPDKQQNPEKDLVSSNLPKRGMLALLIGYLRLIFVLSYDLLVKFGDFIIGIFTGLFSFPKFLLALVFKPKVKPENKPKQLPISSKTTNWLVIPAKSILATIPKKQTAKSQTKVIPKPQTSMMDSPEVVALLSKIASYFDNASKQETEAKVLMNKRLKFIQYFVAGVSILVLINLFGIFLLREGGTGLANGATNQTLGSPVTNSIDTTSVPGVRIVDNFKNTKALGEIGQSMKITDNQISTQNSSNCKTPVPPPKENGCSLVFLPSSLSIPSRGTVFRSIQVEGSLSGDSQLVIEIKNYEKGQVTATVGNFNKDNFSTKLALPESISGVEGISFKFWEKSGPIQISKIAINYVNVEALKPVSGKIVGWNSETETLAALYYDQNENKTLDKKTDRPWVCRPNFPGVKPVYIGKDGSFVIYRDDDCFIDIKPDTWYTDDKKNSLPDGYWLIDISDLNQTYSFKVEKDKKEAVLELQKK